MKNNIHAVNNGDSVIVTIPADYLTNVAEMSVTTNTVCSVNDKQSMLNYVADHFNDTDNDALAGRFFDELMETAAEDGEPWIDSEDDY